MREFSFKKKTKKWQTPLVFLWISYFEKDNYYLLLKRHHHTLCSVPRLSGVDIMTDLDSYYCFQSASPSKVIGQNPKVVLGFHFIRGRGRAACGVNNNLVGVLQLLHNGHCVNLLRHWGLGASRFRTRCVSVRPSMTHKTA